MTWPTESRRLQEYPTAIAMSIVAATMTVLAVASSTFVLTSEMTVTARTKLATNRSESVGNVRVAECRFSQVLKAHAEPTGARRPNSARSPSRPWDLFSRPPSPKTRL